MFCENSSNIIKICSVRIGFTKIKLFRFNLHPIVFHAWKPIGKLFGASLVQQRMVGCCKIECLWMWVMGMIRQLFITQQCPTKLTSSNIWCMRELMWTDKIDWIKKLHCTWPHDTTTLKLPDCYWAMERRLWVNGRTCSQKQHTYRLLYWQYRAFGWMIWI